LGRPGLRRPTCSAPTARLVYHGTIDDNAHEPDKVEARYLQDAVMRSWPVRP
jgi:hypothetical protein